MGAGFTTHILQDTFELYARHKTFLHQWTWSQGQKVHRVTLAFPGQQSNYLKAQKKQHTVNDTMQIPCLLQKVCKSMKPLFSSRGLFNKVKIWCTCNYLARKNRWNYAM